MRIAVNASILGEQPTGTDHYTVNVLRELFQLPALLMHQVEVFTPRPLDFIPPAQQILLPSHLGRSAIRKGNAWRRFLWNQTEFTRLARSYDRVYCPTYNSSLGVAQQIVTIHDLLALRYPVQHPAQAAYCRWALPSLLKNARKIIAVSEATRQEILSHWDLAPSRVAVIHNGFNPQVFHPQQSVQDLTILQQWQLHTQPFALAVGATYPHKNLELLLNLWAELPISHRQHTLAIVGGESAYQRELKALAQSLGFGARVRFLGYVPDEVLAVLYRHAQALLYPSQFEGFGLPLLEAMASACPVISSSTSSLPEVGGEAVIFCHPHDLADWRHSYLELTKSNLLRDHYITKGLAQAQVFSWAKTAQAIVNLLTAP